MSEIRSPERAVAVIELGISIGVIDPVTLAGLERLATDPPMSPEQFAGICAAAVAAGIVREGDIVASWEGE